MKKNVYKKIVKHIGKDLYLFILLFGVVIFTSCITPIKRESIPSVSIYEPMHNEQLIMEFIGFKTDANVLSTTQSTKLGPWRREITLLSPFEQARAILKSDSLRNMGIILENKNIAKNQSFAYFGIYSLQELELYKSSTRYITFIEVVENKYTYSTNDVAKGVSGVVGGSLFGMGIPLLITGVAVSSEPELAKTFLPPSVIMSLGGLISSMISLGIESKTEVEFRGIYNIYIYDTKTKSIIRREVVDINHQNEFKGSLDATNSSYDVIHDYFGKIISNEFLKKYDELNKWLITL